MPATPPASYTDRGVLSSPNHGAQALQLCKPQLGPGNVNLLVASSTNAPSSDARSPLVASQGPPSSFLLLDRWKKCKTALKKKLRVWYASEATMFWPIVCSTSLLLHGSTCPTSPTPGTQSHAGTAPSASSTTGAGGGWRKEKANTSICLSFRFILLQKLGGSSRRMADLSLNEEAPSLLVWF